jgi:hypothetical protein
LWTKVWLSKKTVAEGAILSLRRNVIHEFIYSFFF